MPALMTRRPNNAGQPELDRRGCMCCASDAETHVEIGNPNGRPNYVTVLSLCDSCRALLRGLLSGEEASR